MKELDRLLTDYLERRYPQADAAEKAAFEALLELQDPQLWGLLSGRERTADKTTAAIVAALAAPDMNAALAAPAVPPAKGDAGSN